MNEKEFYKFSQKGVHEILVLTQKLLEECKTLPNTEKMILIKDTALRHTLNTLRSLIVILPFEEKAERLSILLQMELTMGYLEGAKETAKHLGRKLTQKEIEQATDAIAENVFKKASAS